MGTGSPTVVLESGMGDGSAAWMPVQRRMANTTRVCSYDRAGIGNSDAAGGQPRSGTEITEDLHALLRKAKVAPPYVMVGHSVGGLLVRRYAVSYPAEVAGMVLVDSSHEGPGKGAGIFAMATMTSERIDLMSVMQQSAL